MAGRPFLLCCLSLVRSDVADVWSFEPQLHDHIYAQLKARGVEYDVTQTYDSDLFVGASVGLANAEDYETLAGLSGISVSARSGVSRDDISR